MSFTIYKLNHQGEEELSYTGDVLEREKTYVCVRAVFGFETMDLGYVILKKGDIFTEWFYTERWFNVFKVADVDTGQLKGYYCNLTRPAIISANAVKADDLALDIFVQPDGTLLILDEDDYEDLPLTETERHQVQQAINEIKQLVQTRSTPFHDINN